MLIVNTSLWSISVVGVKLWNSQLQDLKGCTNIHRFKKCTNAEKVVNMHPKLNLLLLINCFELAHFCSMGYLFIYFLFCLFVLLL